MAARRGKRPARACPLAPLRSAGVLVPTGKAEVAAGRSSRALWATYKTVGVNMEYIGVNKQSSLNNSCSGVLFNIIGMCMLQKHIRGSSSDEHHTLPNKVHREMSLMPELISILVDKGLIQQPIV